MKKRLLAMILVLVMLLSLVPSFAFATASNDYTQWKQFDPEWNQEEAWPASRYPNATYRWMREAGCAVTSVSMLLRHYNVVNDSNVNNFNPWICNTALGNAGALNSAADIVWGNIRNAYPGFVYMNTVSYSAATLVSLYNQGYACIVGVNYNSHYVAVRSATNTSNIVIMDPGRSNNTSLSAYGGLSSIVYFKTTPLPITDTNIEEAKSVTPTNIVVKVTNSGNYLKSLPCSQSTNQNSVNKGKTNTGDRFEVHNIILNTQGNYWYEVKNSAGEKCYLYSGNTTFVAAKNDLVIDNPAYPPTLNVGSPFTIRGNIRSASGNCNVDYVFAQIRDSNGNIATSSIADTGNNRTSYNLAGSRVDNSLVFNSLVEGTYTYSVYAGSSYKYCVGGNSLISETGEKNRIKVINEVEFKVVGNPVYYTVTFDATGGSGVTSKVSVSKDGTLSSLPTPTRTGYTFNGWYTARTGGTKVTTSTKFTSDSTIYARWTAESYTVRLRNVLNGITADIEEKNVTFGEKYGTLPEPSRKNYSFVGWFTEEDGGVQITEDTIVDSYTRDLYSHWVETVYPVEGGNIGFDKTTGTVTWCEDSVTAAVIPQEIEGVKVERIGVCAFSGHENLKTVVIPNTVVYIGNSAFARTGIKTIDIPNSISEIPQSVFLNCKDLAVVKIGSGTEKIDTSAFGNCTSLKEINVSSNNRVYSSLNGSLCNKAGDKLIFVPPGLDNYYVPDSIVEICDGAFSVCYSSHDIQKNETVNEVIYNRTLERITLGKNTKIINGSLTECLNLKQIVVHPENENLTVYCGMLYTKDLSELICCPRSFDGEISIYPLTKSIGAKAFYDNDSLNEIRLPDALETIGEYAFYSCDHINNVIFPASLQRIGDYAFAYCDSFTKAFVFGAAPEAGENTFCLKKTDIYDPYGRYQDTIYTPSSLYILFNPEVYNTLDSSNCPYYEYAVPSEQFKSSVVYDGTSYDIDLKTGTITYANPQGSSVSIPEYVLGVKVEKIGDDAFGDDRGFFVREINIPDGITSIGDRAFKNCANLRQINIPDSVTSIGEEVFRDCITLERVFIGKGISVIPDRAFYKCSSLTDFQAYGNISVVGDEAFSYSGLTEISLPAATKIGNEAFSYSALTEISLPNCLEDLGSTPFIGCEYLKSIEVESDNNYYTALDGILYNKEKTTLIAYPAALTHSEFAVPESLSTIADGAFAYAKNIKKLYFPKSLTSIGENAFIDVNSLGQVWYPGTTSQWSAINIENGNDNLTNAYIFCYCEELPTDSKIVQFGSCGKDASWMFTEDGTLWIVGDGEMTNFLGRMDQPWYDFSDDIINCKIIGEIVNIGDYSFVYCEHLEEISIPNSVKHIGNKAFSHCTELKHIVLPETIETIGSDAFSSCSSLPSITLPNNLKSIGTGAFSSCSSLLSITLPNNLKSIGAGAFSNCVLLTEMTLPAAISDIPDELFSGCTALASVCFKSDKITSIGDRAFKNTALETFVVPETAVSIGSEAFASCSGLFTLSISGNVTEISSDAFKNNDNLQSIYFNGSVSEWNVFGISLPNTDVICSDGSIERSGKWNGTNGDGITWKLLSDGTLIIRGSGEMVSDDILRVYDPSVGGYYEVNCGPWCYLSEYITSLVIEGDISKISECAFYNCDKIEEITITANVKNIESSAFYGCSALKNIKLPDSLTAIGFGVFQGCSSLKSIVLPEKLKELELYTFRDCTSLEYVYISAGIESICDDFKACCNLKNIDVDSANESFSSVDGILFSKDMTVLVKYPSGKTADSFTVPETVTTILDLAFVHANNLKTITFPDGIDRIESGAFCGCEKLESAYFLGDSPSYFGDLAFCTDDNKVPSPFMIYFYDYKEFDENFEGIRAVFWSTPTYCGYPSTELKADDPKEEMAYPVENGNIYFVRSTGTVTRVDDTVTTAIIPEAIDGYAVKYVKWGLFSGHKNIKYVSLPDTIESLDYNVFTNSSVENVKLPEKLLEICEGTFYGCNNLKTITIPGSVTTIGDKAFYKCESLQDITVPDSVTIIGDEAFYGCKSLSSVEFGSGIEVIGESAFEHCGALNSIAITSNLKEVGDFAFAYCGEDCGYYSTEIVFYCDAPTSINIPLVFYGISGEVYRICYSQGWENLTQGVSVFHEEYYETSIDATCEHEGGLRHTCKSCGYSYMTDRIPAEDHVIVDDPGVPASCSSPGYTSGTHCEVCGTVLSGHETIPTLGHTFKDVVVDPTCISRGYTQHICESCGYTITDTYVGVVDHSWNQGVVYEEATAEHEGTMLYICDICGDSKTESIPKLVHEHEYVESVTAPTCTEQGYTTHTCSCGDSYVDSYVDALGHDFGEWVETTAPTCTDKGEETRCCSRCDACETRETAELGHHYGEPSFTWTEDNYCEASFTCSRCGDVQNVSCKVSYETADASCTVAGTTVYTAEVCFVGKTYTDTKTVVGKPAPHEYGEPVFTWDGFNCEAEFVCTKCGDKQVLECTVTSTVAKAASCTEAGVKLHTASAEFEGRTYSAEKSEVLEMKSHTPNNAVTENETAATCTAEGSYDEVIYCSECGEELLRVHKATVALGHDLVHHDGKAATCTEAGWDAYDTCSRCDYTTYKEIPATGHNYKDDVCTVCGAKDPDYKPPVKENPFVDVSESSVYYDAILWAYYHEPQQITGGFTATEFRPGNPCTRGQVVTFLWRAAACPEPTGDTSMFKDAASIASPYQKAVAWAVEKGITTGFADGTFRPNDSVTRAQFVTFLWRYEGKPATSGSIAGFRDAASISGPYQQAVAWAVEKGITTGYNDGTFRPNATCTRWAVVLFMYRDMA